ncbi:MAG: DUF2877 domain-containing protein [Chloroflexota bacterium]
MKLLNALQIGLCAAENLSKNRSGEVIGITSKGIFLKLTDGSIVFISPNRYGNPLTLNLDTQTEFPSVSPGESIHLGEYSIHFDISSIIIQTKTATIYSSKKSSKPMSLPLDLKQTIHFLSILRSRLGRSVDLLDEVLAFIDESLALNPPDPESQLVLEKMVRYAFVSPATCLHPIRFFVGRGRGLTPSGDDLLMGWIYALSRLVGFENQKIEQLRQVLFQAIENRTTTISLNLIKASAYGEIDERLLHAFETMIGLNPFHEDTVQEVLEWGSSSGIEACAGMGLGIFTLNGFV